MPTADELAMLQKYGGNDFQNQDWNAILKAIQGFNPDQYDGGIVPGGVQVPGFGMSAPGAGGWVMDEYQPGNGLTQLTRFASNQSGATDGNGRYDTVTLDANGKPTQQWQQMNSTGDHGGIFSNIVPILGAVLAGQGLSTAFSGTGAAGADAGAGAAETAGYAIPTSEELAAAGFGDGTGVGLTGAGGIGAASSVAEALGSGAYTDLGYAGLDGALSPGISDFFKSAVTPSNIAKLVTALKGSGGQSGGGLSIAGGGGGVGGVFNQAANETPGMIAPAAQPQSAQQQQIAQALLLGDSQPKFSQVEFSPMYKLAQALQDT